MRLWVTRTQPGADRLAARLKALGHSVLIDPLTSISPLSFDANLDGITALAFTSGHGVARFAVTTPRRDLPVWAVGEETARAARDAGFENVAASDGSGAHLARDMADQSGRVLWVRGRRAAFDLDKALAAQGVPVEVAIAYEVTPRMAETGYRALAAGMLDGVVLQSIGAADALFDELTDRGGIARLDAVDAFVPSARIASALTEVIFRAVHIAEGPDEDALVSLLGKPPIAV